MQFAMIALALAASILGSLSQRCKPLVLLVLNTHPIAAAPVKVLAMQDMAAMLSPIAVPFVLSESTRALPAMSLVHCALQACIRKVPEPLSALSVLPIP